jgi:hypothetical protein
VRTGRAVPCDQGKIQGTSRIWAGFRKNRPKKLNDSRSFQQNSLRVRTGNFFAEQGMKIPCSAKSRDISRLTRRLFGAF